MDDLISRQAAIDALNGELTITGRENAKTIRDYINGVDKKLRELPSAERTGRWLPDNNSVYEVRFVCSECKESQVVPTIGFTKYKPLWDFCPYCGADMRGEQDE